MKHIFYLLPVLFLSIIACDNKKNTDDLHTVCPASAILQGPWKLNAYWNSPGSGDLTWYPATQQVSISFGGNNIFSSSRDKFDRYYTTEVKYDNVTDTILKLYKKGTTDTSSYVMKINRDTLVMFYIGCFEGCAEQYARPDLSLIQTR